MVIPSETYARTLAAGFSARDLEDLQAAGKRPEDAAGELQVLREGVRPLDVVRPCAAGDGVLRLNAQEARAAAMLYFDDAWRRQITKFVVAAGSASRMFQLFETADEGQTRTFCDRLRELALFPALDAAARRRGLDASALAARGEWRPLADALLDSGGLGMRDLPKGLIPFHAYADGPRTALEEHVAEAVRYCAGYGNRIHLHAVVGAEHASSVQAHLEAAGRRFENANIRIRTDVSVQSSASRTVALDARGEPLRDGDGRLVLRPAGHGAALENLDALHGDIVFLRTVDNILPDAFHGFVSCHKRVLGGVLMQVEAAVRASLLALSQGEAGQDVLDAAAELLAGRLSTPLPARWERLNSEQRRRFLLDRLNRPLRVCAMVPNEGRPGGAPVWIRAPEGERLRIVDRPEVDLDSPHGRRVWESAAYFNPADIACGLRDFRGRPFELRRFAAPAEWYVLERSRRGQPVRLLERSGLWNGAMAEWNTVFVETPAETLRPVKSILDLLEAPPPPLD